MKETDKYHMGTLYEETCVTYKREEMSRKIKKT
jgi:hypothetical protein